MKILTFGELLLRLSSPGYTKLFQKDTLDSTFCGAEANVAVSLASFGLRSEFITKLPDNDIGKAAINSLRYFGVKTDNIHLGNGRMGLYYLEKGASQRPSKVIYDRANSSIALANVEEFDWDTILQDVDWFHWSGITPALSSNLATICNNACRAAKSKGIMVSCDLNYRKNLWTTEDAQKVMKNLMKYTTLCIGNEEDAEMVLGITPPENDISGGKLNKKSYIEVAQKICHRFGCEKVAFTLRESFSASTNGWSAMLYDNSEDESYFSRNYTIQIIDRVGGGDSFSAGLIYSLINNKDNQSAIEFATAASCLKHTIEGDYNRTTVQDVENLLSNGGNGRVQR